MSWSGRFGASSCGCAPSSWRQPPQTPKALVHEVAEVAGLDATAFDWVLDRIVGHNVQPLRPYDPVGDRYVEQLERLVRFVDAFEPTRAASAK